MQRLVGNSVENLKKAAENAIEGAQKIRNKWTKTVIWTGITLASLGTAVYLHLRRQKPEPDVQIPKAEKEAA